MRVQKMDAALDRWAVRQRARNLIRVGKVNEATRILYETYGPARGYEELAKLRSKEPTHKQRRPRGTFSDALRKRGICPSCGARRSLHPDEWVEINGHPKHYTEDCLRRQLEGAKKQLQSEVQDGE